MVRLFGRRRSAFTPNYTPRRKSSGGRVGGRKQKGFKAKKNYKKRPFISQSKKVPLSKFNDFIDTVIEVNSDGDPVQGIKYLKKAAIAKQLKIKGKKIKITKPPISGVTSSKDKEIPLEVSENTRRISGTNGLYTAKEHNVYFKSGEPVRGWLKRYVKENGLVERKLIDTTSQYQLSHANRSDFTKMVGFNQKYVQFVDTHMFGLEASELNGYFDVGDYDTSILRDQVAYGACTGVKSKMTLTSLNKYVPTYIKLYLCKYNMPGNEWLDIREDLINTTLSAQDNGTMPGLYQQDIAFDHPLSLVGKGICVDPKTRGVRAANKWKALVDVIETKTVKLAAGDRLNLDYTHQFGSGVNVTRLHGLLHDASFNSDMPLSYCLMIEVYGEEVDAYQFVSQNKVVKGTAPACIQFEFEKTVYGSVPSDKMSNLDNNDSWYGFLTSDFGIKVFSKSPLVDNIRRYFATYDKLTATDATGIRVPIMSDSLATDVGKIS